MKGNNIVLYIHAVVYDRFIHFLLCDNTIAACQIVVTITSIGVIGVVGAVADVVTVGPMRIGVVGPKVEVVRSVRRVVKWFSVVVNRVVRIMIVW